MVKRQDYLLEVCVASISSAKAAVLGGADRLELCSNLLEGGITPSYGLIKKVRQLTNLPIFILIRPRGGDFLYTSDEFEIIIQDIIRAKKLGVDGIVSGFLKANGSIDSNYTAKALEVSYPLPFTFHRAFDVCKNPFKELEVIIKLGVQRVLTSGQKNTAYQGINTLKEFTKAAHNRINIMAGSGINSENILQILQQTNVREFHASCSLQTKSKMTFLHPEVKMGKENMQDENTFLVTSKEKVEALKSILNSLG